MKQWEGNFHKIDNAIALAYKKFATMGIIEEMSPGTKFSRLGEIEVELKRKVTKLEEWIRSSTPPEVMKK